jgi:uroporphyrinogen decarboxylase
LGDPDFESKLDNCLVRILAGPPLKEVAPDIWEDEFGVRWDRRIDKDIGNPCNRVITPENLADYQFPDPDDASRIEHADREKIEKTIVENRGRFIIGGLGFSLFERAWTMAGMETILMGMVTNPDFVHNLLDRILDFNLRVIDNFCSYDIDGMWFGDDWGMQAGLIMGPDLWREFIKPRLTQMYGRVKANGKYVLIHCCGKVDGIFPDLIEVGVDIFNPFQPEVMDVYEIKRMYGDALCFWGGIGVQSTLPFDTVTEVKDEVRRLIEEVGEDGGYIAGPSHSIPGDAKPENILAMIEVLENQ